MNDLFIAAGRSGVAGFAEETLKVQQFKVHNFDLWFSPAAAVKAFLENKDYSDEILTQLFKEHGVQVLHLLEIATGKTQKDLILHATQNEQEFKLLLKTMLEVNAAYFKEPKPRRRAESGGEESSWFNAFQFLADHGHRHSEIMQMSYGCFMNYLKAAQGVYLEDKKLDSSVIRAAQHSDKKGFEKFQQELSKR